MSYLEYPARTHKQLYVGLEENSGDNERTRSRLIAVFISFSENRTHKVAKNIEAEIGIYPGSLRVASDVRKFMRSLEWGDFLDVLGELYHTIKAEIVVGPRGDVARRELGQYLAMVNRVFGEQKARLVLKNDGIIHPKYDMAFDQQRMALIRGLDLDSYEAARLHVEACEAALLKDPVDGSQAIRSIFLASENIFKQLGRKPRLGVGEARDLLSPILENMYPEKTNGLRASLRILKSFGEWIDAAHFYRHEEGKPEPSQPTEELGLLLVTQGFSFTRWLVDIHQFQIHNAQFSGENS
ncbi:hypothetical protein [Roseivivax sp. THAF197b]|uniref:hypothetical protein n=1 Tax=Roseivivax sp. THAF197b TaxID=2588299 RepID=UPI001268C31D|nr:hypothetical protein [Roseivivax sp. THAF197b]QFS82292.1 hypothetical protein FIV09_05580 [Roseivivax sp. THAF197b]